MPPLTAYLTLGSKLQTSSEEVHLYGNLTSGHTPESQALDQQS